MSGGEPGPIERAFHAHAGRILNKWLHYLPLYDRYFAGLQGKPVTMIEIGVGGGGSLELWRGFFGPDATIFGIEFHPERAKLFDPPNQVRQGTQTDPAFLRAVLEETGPPDIILDDGSHIASHQLASFRVLWPALKPGGLYVIEDLHTSYWERYEGGYGRPGTAIELAKTLIDDMHGWHHSKPMGHAAREELGGVHVHDSMVVIEKTRREAPRAERVGAEA
jgi:hypothetical protein